MRRYERGPERPDDDWSGGQARATRVGRAAFAVAVGMRVVTTATALLSP
jgi:hypothetical protein